MPETIGSWKTISEWRILSPQAEAISMLRLPQGEIIGDNDQIRTSQFDVLIPKGVGTFQVVSTDGQFQGVMRIEALGEDRVLTFLSMSMPREEADEPVVVKGGA